MSQAYRREKSRKEIVRQRKHDEMMYRKAKAEIKKINKQNQEQKEQNPQKQKEEEKPEEEEDIRIYTKIINGNKNHVWVHMIGTGSVTLKLVMDKMDELQVILNNMSKVPDLRFTFIFDFRELQEFAELETLKKFGSFMNRNKPLFENKLNQSYLLLRRFLWRAVVKALFFIYKPTKPVDFELPDEIDQALCKEL